jgi:hypothetical protein
MGKRDGRQKGPQKHAEGQHGSKAHAQFLKQLESGEHEEPRGERPEDRVRRRGGHRLLEDRQQHDEPAKKAEKTRLSRKIERDDLERTDFQVPGGATRHPELPED